MTDASTRIPVELFTEGSVDTETPAEQPRRTWVEHVMGMPVSLQLRGPGLREPSQGEPGLGDSDVHAEVLAAVDAAIAELHHVDALFSTWQPGSEVSRIRRGELDVATADVAVREVAELCELARRRTDGAFDADLPGTDGVRRFDPTGLVKGWAVQRCAEQLSAALPEHDVLVNAGGDIAMLCRRTDTPDWSIAVEYPLDRSQVLAALQLRTGGVATSGTAARGAHLIDPRSGQPATGLASVTVIGPSLMWADVYATAAFVLGTDAPGWLRTLPDHAWLIVHADGAVTSSSAT